MEAWTKKLIEKRKKEKKKRGKMTVEWSDVSQPQRGEASEFHLGENLPWSMISVIVVSNMHTFDADIIFRSHSIFVEVGSRYIRPIFIAGTRASRYLREESKVNWNPTLDSCESFTFVSFTGTKWHVSTIQCVYAINVHDEKIYTFSQFTARKRRFWEDNFVWKMLRYFDYWMREIWFVSFKLWIGWSSLL